MLDFMIKASIPFHSNPLSVSLAACSSSVLAAVIQTCNQMYVVDSSPVLFLFFFLQRLEICSKPGFWVSSSPLFWDNRPFFF